MFDVEAAFDQEIARREAAVIEAARRFAVTYAAYFADYASDEGYRPYKEAREDLVAAVAALKELTGPLQEPRP